MTFVIRFWYESAHFCTDVPLCPGREGRTLEDIASYLALQKQEEFMAIVAIFLMFSAVVAMVKRIDKTRQQNPVLAFDSREMDYRVRLHR